MKIGVAVVGCHRRGGIERVALETVNALAQRGHAVRLVTYDADRAALHPEVHLTRIAKPKGPRLRAALAFPAKAHAALNRGNTVDVRCGFGSLSAPGSVVWVTSVHARWLEVVRQGEVATSWKRRFNPFHPLIIRQERRQYAQGFHRRLLAMGPAITDDLNRFCATPRSHVAELPHGFDDRAFSVARSAPLREPTRAALGFAATDRVVLCVANEIPRKGVPALIRAMVRLNPAKTRLLLVGRLDSGEVRRLADEAGLNADRLRLEPPSDDVAKYYAAADVFALPTLYDAWGLVIVEALACGCPVITTARAGAAAVLGPTSGEVLNDPADIEGLAAALNQWLNHPNPNRAAIAASVADLTWDRVIERYDEHLRAAAR